MLWQYQIRHRFQKMFSGENIEPTFYEEANNAALQEGIASIRSYTKEIVVQSLLVEMVPADLSADDEVVADCVANFGHDCESGFVLRAIAPCIYGSTDVELCRRSEGHHCEDGEGDNLFHFSEIC